MARLLVPIPSLPAFPAAGTVLSVYCTGYDKYEQRANGSGGSTNVLVATNSTYCGYTPPPTNPAAGTVLSTFCTGYDKYERRADGSGGYTDVLVQANSTYCGYTPPPASGTVLATFCTGYNKYERRADGSGGYTDVLVETNSAYCGYTPPPASGTVLSTFCTGYDKYEQRADGSGGSTNVLVQANSSYCGYVPPPTTQTFSSSTTFTTPAGVTNLQSVVGKGQDGTPATAGTYGPSIHHSALVARVQGFDDDGGATSARFWSWGSSQADISAIRDQINVGGSGSYTSYNIDQYNNGYLKFAVTTSWTNVSPSSAYTTLSAGWKTTGGVLPGDYGTLTVDWEELGPFTSGTPATTGSNTTGFGKTFTGGVGGTAATTTYTNVAVTASTAYTIVVPSGGYITITY